MHETVGAIEAREFIEPWPTFLSESLCGGGDYCVTTNPPFARVSIEVIACDYPTRKPRLAAYPLPSPRLFWPLISRCS